MSTSELRTTETSATGVQSYRVVDPLDATGRMTVETTEGETRTVVGCLDDLIQRRLSDRAPGATVRMELSPTGEGYVASRVLPGSLPAL